MNLPSADFDLPELALNRWHIWAAKDRFPLYAALAILGAFLIGLLVAHNGLIGPANRYRLVTDIGPLPQIEPFILRNVPKAVAKRTNDAVPLTKTPVPPAAAFFFQGSPADFERATDCLAATIYYEAGAEPDAGQMAVAQVVLNRVRHPAYPKTVCGVVFQGHERHTGCQFSYTCDGSMARRPSFNAWARYRSLAQAMLRGFVYRPVGLATHYHTDWVLPAWSARLDKIRVERTHLFFRYHGYWGSPAAFRGTVAHVEPAFAKLAALSPAHGRGEATADAVMTAEPERPLIPEAPDLERVSATLDAEDKSKEVFLIYIDPLLEATALTRMAEGACGTRKTCKVFAWADPALLPKGLPLEPADRASMAYSFIRTGSAGTGKQRWNCALFPRESQAECL